jgi:hypothetical protein
VILNVPRWTAPEFDSDLAKALTAYGDSRPLRLVLYTTTLRILLPGLNRVYRVPVTL